MDLKQVDNLSCANAAPTARGVHPVSPMAQDPEHSGAATDTSDHHYDVNGDIYTAVVKEGKVYKPPLSETKDKSAQVPVVNVDCSIITGHKQKHKQKDVDPLYSDLDFIKEQVKANQLSSSMDDLSEPGYESVPFLHSNLQPSRGKSHKDQHKSPPCPSSPKTNITQTEHQLPVTDKTKPQKDSGDEVFPSTVVQPLKSQGQPIIAARINPSIRRLQKSKVRTSATCLSMYEKLEDDDIINQEQDAILNQRKVLQELVDTEREYIDILDTLKKGVKEFDTAVNKDRKLRGYNFTELLASLERIHELHIKHMLPDLHTKFTVVNGEPLFADTFNKLGPFFKIYQSYASQLGLHYANISYLTDHHKKIADVLQNINSKPEFEHLSLEEHMLEPIQRIPAYKVMLEKYKRFLNPTGEEYKKTTDALTYLNDENQKFEEIISNQDSFRESMNVARRLTGIDGVVLVNTRRRFIMEGQVMCVEAKQKKTVPRHLFLFSDTLLVCMLANRHGKHQFVYSLQLDDVQACGTYIQKIGSSVAVPRKNFIVIQTSRRQLLLNYKTPEMKNTWIREMHLVLAKYGYTETFNDIETTNPSVLRQLQVAPVLLPDDFSEKCMECSSGFSYIKRKREYCATCGRIVCSKCCSYEVHLPFSKFKSGKTCGKCFLYIMNNHPQLLKSKEKMGRTRSVEQEFNDSLQQRKQSGGNMNPLIMSAVDTKLDKLDSDTKSNSDIDTKFDDTQLSQDVEQPLTLSSAKRNKEDDILRRTRHLGLKCTRPEDNIEGQPAQREYDAFCDQLDTETPNEDTVTCENTKIHCEPPYATIGEMKDELELSKKENPKPYQVPVRTSHHYDTILLKSENVSDNYRKSDNDNHKLTQQIDNTEQGDIPCQSAIYTARHYDTISPVTGQSTSGVHTRDITEVKSPRTGTTKKETILPYQIPIKKNRHYDDVVLLTDNNDKSTEQLIIPETAIGTRTSISHLENPSAEHGKPFQKPVRTTHQYDLVELPEETENNQKPRVQDHKFDRILQDSSGDSTGVKQERGNPEQCDIPFQSAVYTERHYDTISSVTGESTSGVHTCDITEVKSPRTSTTKKETILPYQKPIKKNRHYDDVVLPTDNNDKTTEQLVIPKTAIGTRTSISHLENPSTEHGKPFQKPVRTAHHYDRVVLPGETKQQNKNTDLWYDPDVEGCTEC